MTAFANAMVLAIPDELVTTVALLKVTLAPVEGGTNVTETPGSGRPLESFTRACSAIGKAAEIGPVCDAPPATSMLAGSVVTLLTPIAAVAVPAVAVML